MSYYSADWRRELEVKMTEEINPLQTGPPWQTYKTWIKETNNERIIITAFIRRRKICA